MFDRNRQFTMFAAALVLAGCSNARSPQLGYVVEDSAGVEVIRNLGSGVRLLDTRVVLRIGSVSGSPETLFHNISNVDVFPDGHILLTNASSTIREYDPNGRLVREFGRRGEGPGEFGALPRVDCLGDTVVVFSMLPNRLSVFTREGEFLTSHNVGLPFEYSRLTVVGDRVLLGRDPSPTVSVGEVIRSMREYVEIDLVTGEVSPPRFALPGSLNIGEKLITPILDQGRIGTVLQGTRYLTVPEQGYRLEVWDWSGELLRVITREYEPVPITRRELDRFEEVTRNRFRKYVGAPGIESELRAALERAPRVDHIPPIQRLWAADDGTLWVWRRDLYEDPFGEALLWEGGAEEGHEMQPRTYEHFDVDGRYRGSVVLPPHLSPSKWGSDFLLAVERDDLDVEYIVRLAIEMPG